MSAKQDIAFTGDLDLESDIRDVKPGDYIYALNLRNVFTENRIDGSAENISANEEVVYSLPAGTNKCVGRYEDETNNTCFYHIYNSNGNHRLLRYYAANQSNKIQVILSGSILGSTEWNYVTHSNLVDDQYFWVEGDNPQRRVNVDMANDLNKIVEFKLCVGRPPGVLSGVQYQFSLGATSITNTFNFPLTLATRAEAASFLYDNLLLWANFMDNFIPELRGEYVNVVAREAGIWTITVTPTGSLYAWYKAMNWYPSITQKVLDVVAQPAWAEPDTVLVDDTAFDGNFLLGKSYQFRTKFYYEDGQVSTLSKDSRMQYNDTLPLGPNFPYDYSDYTQDPVAHNAIKVTYSDGGRIFQNRELIKQIEIFFRNTNTEQYRSCALLYDYELDGNYYFYNNVNGATIGDAEGAKQYQAIPITSKTQEVVNNKLFYGHNKVGYDNVDVSAIVSVAAEAPKAWDDVNIQRAKFFGKYRMGVVYFDRFGRNNFVNRNTGMDVIIPIDSRLIYDATNNRNYISFEINNTPPDWAVTYAWVRTKDLTHASYTEMFHDDLVSDPVTYQDKSGATIAFGSTVSQATITVSADAVYEFNSGDILRIMFYTPDSAVLGSDATYLYSVEYQVISYDPATRKLVVVYPVVTTASLPDLNTTPLFWFMEAYTPYRESENELYYGFYETYAILNPGTVNRLHAAGWQGVNQTSSTPATGYFYFGWDTFLVHKPLGFPYAADEFTFAAETPCLNTEENIEVSGIGRPTAIAPLNKQVTLVEDIAFSDVWNLGTAYNGFGTWEPLNHRALPTGFGELSLMKNMDNILVCACRNKTFSVYVDKGVIMSQDGSAVVSVAETVIGAIYDLNGQYGTVNPESAARKDGVLLWWDVYRGVVCQYSKNGIEEVSRYKASSYFSKKGADGLKVLSEEYKVLGGIHARFKEYIMVFPDITVDAVEIPGVTIAFNYATNGWKTFYSFTPEQIMGMGVNLVTFKDGKLYLHKQSALKNTFYGVAYDTEVTAVVNEFGATNKSMLSFSMESSGPFDIPEIITPATEWNVDGQESEVLRTDMEFMNGSYWAPFFMNKLSPGFDTESDALIDGEQLQAQVMTMKMLNDSTAAWWIRRGHVYFILDPLTNK